MISFYGTDSFFFLLLLNLITSHVSCLTRFLLISFFLALTPAFNLILVCYEGYDRYGPLMSIRYIMIQTISSITPERMVWWRTVNSQRKHPDEGFLLNFFWKTLNFYGIYGTYVLLVLYTAQFCCGISECQMGHAMVKCAKLFERKEQAGALLDIPYHMLYLTRHTIPYYKLCLTRHTTPYYTLCLTSRDAILGHKSVSVDRDTRTEARCDTGLCNTCDTVTHRGHLLPMLTSRQICRALGSRINKNLSSARIADQQDGYRDSPAMPALSKPRGI